MCVLYMAAWLTQRGMYLGDVHARKGIFIDEAWALSTFTPAAASSNVPAATPAYPWPARTRPTSCGSTWRTSSPRRSSAG